MGLKAYVAKRIVYMIFLIWVVLTLNFIIFQVMPSDPLQFFAGKPGALTKARVDELLTLWGFKEPIYVKYSKYIINMMTFQFGYSSGGGGGGKPVVALINESLPNTLVLMGSSTILSIIIGTLLGALAAYKRGGKLDTTMVVGSLITYSLPTFWMGMILLIIFGQNLGPLGFFPIGKTVSYFSQYRTGLPPPLFQAQIFSFAISIPSITEIVDRLWHLALPMTVLTLFQYGGFLLLTRATMASAYRRSGES